MKILIVDDDEQIIKMLRPVLIQQNYAVEVAMDGQMGLDLLENVPCSLILLDVMLPKVNGIQFCQRLRAQRNETPILMMTARDTSTDKVLGLDAGADDYIVKPVDINELIARIRALLRRGTTAPPILEWGCLQFNPSTREMSYAGKQLNFRPKELAIMELLLRQKQRVLNRQMILDHLWSLTDCPDDNTIKAHIRAIRRVLESVGAGDLIETLYGKGYRLNPAYLEQPISPLSIPVSTSGPDLSATIAATWQQTQHLTRQRLQALKDAVQILRHQPDPLALQQAETICHQLAGILGSFGFQTGSDLAKVLEQHFKCHRESSVSLSGLGLRMEPIVTVRVEQWILLLDQTLRPTSGNIAEPVTGTVLPKTTFIQQSVQPLVLVVSQDRNWVNQLVQAEKTGLFQLQCCSPDHLNQTLAEQQPGAIILDLTQPDRENALNLLHRIQTYQPHPPVLLAVDLRSDRIGSWHNDLAIAELKAEALLQKTWSPSRVLSILADFIPSNIKVLVLSSVLETGSMMSQICSVQQIQLTHITRSTELWNELNRVNPDILILDHLDENPADICRVIRTDSRWIGLSIFLLDRSEGHRLPQPLLLGVDGYLTTEASPSEWMTMMRQTTQRVRALKRLAKDELLLAMS